MTRIAAIVGVKDERDLISQCLERLWSVGVGPILVLDDSSTDGTREIVQGLMRNAPVEVALQTFDPDFSEQLRYGGRVIGPFLARNSPEWVLFIDADEFLICSGDDLESRLVGETGSVLAIERYNVPFTSTPFLPASGADAELFKSADVITGREVLSRAVLAEDPSRRWIMHRIAPKLICRPDVVASFGLGWHQAFDADGRPIPVAPANGAMIVHLPMTTRDRFVMKVDNTRSFMERWGSLYQGEAAWHWRRWIDLADRGLIEEEFEHQRMDEDTIARLRASGAIESAATVLERSRRA